MINLSETRWTTKKGKKTFTKTFMINSDLVKRVRNDLLWTEDSTFRSWTWDLLVFIWDSLVLIGLTCRDLGLDLRLCGLEQENFLGPQAVEDRLRPHVSFSL